MSETECLSNESFTALVAGTLHFDERPRIEHHIGVCPVCRQRLVSMKVGHTDDMPVIAAPDWLKQRARHLPTSDRTLLMFRPRVSIRRYVGIAASIILLATITAVVTIRLKDRGAKPQQDVMRAGESVIVAPQIVSPVYDAIITSEQIDFVWNEVPSTIRYTLTLQDERGDILFERTTEQPKVSISAGDSNLEAGHHYFWVVSAKLVDGSIVKSGATKFTLNTK